MAKNDTTKKNTNDSNRSAKNATPSNIGNGKVNTENNTPEANPKLSNAGSEVIVKKSLGSFFSDVQLELSKVAWPSRQQLISESIAVLLMVIVAAVLVYLVDSLFGWAASQVFQ